MSDQRRKHEDTDYGDACPLNLAPNRPTRADGGGNQCHEHCDIQRDAFVALRQCVSHEALAVDHQEKELSVYVSVEYLMNPSVYEVEMLVEISSIDVANDMSFPSDA